MERCRWRRRTSTVRAASARPGSHPGGGARPDRISPAEVSIAALLAATPFVFHWLYGALVSEIALLLVTAQAALLGAIIAVPRLRRDFSSPLALAPAAVLFLAVIALAAYSLTPSGGAATAGVWALVGRPAAGTLDSSATLVEIVKLSGLACVFLSAAAIGRGNRRLDLTLRLIVYFGAAFAVISMLLSSADAIYATQGRRVEARFLNPNTAGAVFGAIAVLALAMTWRRLRKGGMRLEPVSLALDGASLAITVSALLMTLSRGALGATLCAALLLVTWELFASKDRRGRRSGNRASYNKTVAAMVASGLVILLLGWVFADRVWPNLFALEDDVRTRSLTAAVHWRAIGSAPWLGYGLGTFETVNTLMFTPRTFSTLWNIRAAQNVYIQWVEQAGWVGASCMFASIGAVLFGPFRTALRGGPSAWRARALIAVDLVFLIHGMVDFSLETYSVAALWALLLGLNFGSAAAESRRDRKVLVPADASAMALGSMLAAGFCLLSLDGTLAGEPGRFSDPMAAGLDRASDLTFASARLGDDRDARLAQARSLSWAALRLSPCDTGAWLRLAEIDAAMRPDLGPDGVAALRNSYRVAPIDPYQAFWRIRFALEHWAVLPPDLMDDADREVFGLAGSWAHRDGLARTLNDTASRRGRLVAALWAGLYGLPFSSHPPSSGAKND